MKTTSSFSRGHWLCHNCNIQHGGYFIHCQCGAENITSPKENGKRIVLKAEIEIPQPKQSKKVKKPKKKKKSTRIYDTERWKTYYSYEGEKTNLTTYKWRIKRGIQHSIAILKETPPRKKQEKFHDIPGETLYDKIARKRKELGHHIL